MSMKKNIIWLLAVVCLAACVQEEIDSGQQPEAIAFGGRFTEYATRAASSNETLLEGFNVWGFMNNTSAPLFEGTEVKLEGAEWTYEGDDRYWIPGQLYYFAALAPMDSPNISLELASNGNAETGLGILTFTNDKGEEDLLYSKYHNTAIPFGNDPVSFNFNHLLAKVKISFNNQLNNDDVTLRVSDIKICAPKIASIDLTADQLYWHTPASSAEFDFAPVEIKGNGTKSTEDLFMIPASSEYSYDISFDIDIVKDGTEEIIYHSTKISKITGVSFEMGSAYNLSTTINPDITNTDTRKRQADWKVSPE